MARCRVRLGLLFAVLAVLGWGTAAAAQAAPDAEALRQAKTHFKQGNALLQAGKHHKALDQFLASRALVPSVQNTVNTAICLAELGRYDEALDLYEEALARFSEDLTPELLSSLGPEIAVLRERTGRIEVEANFDGALVVDGKPRGTLPLPGPVRVLPGTHKVQIMRDGSAAFETSVKVAAGESVVVRAALAPTSESPPEPTEGAPLSPAPEASDASAETGGGGAQRTVALIVGGLGVVGIAVGAYFGVSAMTKKADYDSHTSGGQCVDMACETLSGEAHSAGTASTIAFVAGGALLATGIVLYVTGGSDDGDTRALRVGAMADAGGVRLAMGGAW